MIKFLYKEWKKKKLSCDHNKITKFFKSVCFFTASLIIKLQKILNFLYMYKNESKPAGKSVSPRWWNNFRI